ncbi:hypothetical protein IB267_16955 [Ensifer sp. ENS09]|uniref:hypothetical protein n=1 Tax=Ensifer sp. ENS09 TaxID=2769263 RepID=UPI001784DE38|nr:hypothetical protein [Ensifer sp. ENS09]MBD9650047.1 hypothetical protein [Ensifer sp. ENS09]
MRIATALDTSPNWLLGVALNTALDQHLAALIERFANAANGMTKQEVELCVIQAEAIVATKAHA